MKLKITFIFVLIVLLCESVYSELAMCVKSYGHGVRSLYPGINNVCKDASQYAISCNIFGRNCDYCDLNNDQDEKEINQWCDKQGGWYMKFNCYPLGCSFWCSPNYQKC